MAGDITRSTFQAIKHYSAVRMQQGRVQMDADWNEQADIRAWLNRTAHADIIGPSGVPQENAGFAIQAPGSNLLIAPGRIYVDGILCENENEVLIASPAQDVTLPQPDLPGVEASGNTLSFAPLLVALGGGPGFDLPTSGNYAAYLHVWERDITALDDPSIREIALGGPDTTTRTKTVWQVKLHQLPAQGSAAQCPGSWADIFPASTAQLQAQAQPGAGSNDPCTVPAQAGYRSLENQLYRVEIHQGGKLGSGQQPSFKWSRDNASVVAGWTGQDSQNPNNLFVSTLGKDQTLGFAAGSWVELTDDTRELWQIPGALVQINSAQVTANGPTLTMASGGSINFKDYPSNPKVRRWDQGSAPIAIQEGQWLDLENGIQIFFTPGGTYATGDYWLVPARTATPVSSPTVLWPTDSNGQPVSLRPQGIRHHYCGLAVLSFDTTHGWTVACDCRPVFPSLAAGPSLHVVDVRTVNPDGELPNDTALPLLTLINGLKVVCDGPIDPATINPSTFFLTLDVPFPGTDGGQSGIFPFSNVLLLGGSVGVNGNVAYWIPNIQTDFWLGEELAALASLTKGAGELLLRVTLKGNAIWSQGRPAMLLDGEAVAVPATDNSGNSYSALRLPSGDGRPGGNFETWFWVPGYCDSSFPAGYIPFTQITSIAGPDTSGDRVIVGTMTLADYQNKYEKLAQSDVVVRKIYCQRILMAASADPETYAFAYVPTSKERTGDFSDFLQPIINPLTKVQFPGNKIPPPALGGGVVWAWRVRSVEMPVYGYGYGYGGGYGYGFPSIGAELI